VRALEAARRLGVATIGMTGAGGVAMAPLCDILLDVPEKATPRVQQVHVCLYHYLCQQVERRIAEQA
jgi:D-sedoheptulose 7-phosphate isomerase